MIRGPGTQGNTTLIYGEGKNIKALPVVTRKINPTKYLYRFKNPGRSFLIRLDENFDPGWKIFFVFPPEKSKKPEGSSDFIESPLGTFGARKILVSEQTPRCKPEADCQTVSNLKLTASLRNKTYLEKLRNRMEFAQLLEWPDSFHWQANGFANAWFIDKSLLQSLWQDFGIRPMEETEDYLDLVIEYTPQKLHFVGLVGSLTTMTFLVLCGLILSIKRIK